MQLEVKKKQCKTQEVKKSSVHKNKLANIQLEVKENSVHNTKVTNIQLEVRKNSAHST